MHGEFTLIFTQKSQNTQNLLDPKIAAHCDSHDLAYSACKKNCLSMTNTRITLFAEILLPIPVPGTFTYRVPYALNDQVRVGQRAVVQFGKTKIMSGLIVNLT